MEVVLVLTPVVVVVDEDVVVVGSATQAAVPGKSITRTPPTIA